MHVDQAKPSFATRAAMGRRCSRFPPSVAPGGWLLPSAVQRRKQPASPAFTPSLTNPTAGAIALENADATSRMMPRVKTLGGRLTRATSFFLPADFRAARGQPKHGLCPNDVARSTGCHGRQPARQRRPSRYSKTPPRFKCSMRRSQRAVAHSTDTPSRSGAFPLQAPRHCLRLPYGSVSRAE